MASLGTLIIQTVVVWIIISVSGKSAAAGDTLCPYDWYDEDFSNSWSLLGRPQRDYKHCQWGCCSEYEEPCCGVPIGLIVGVVMGGLLGLTLLVLCICCCCCFYRRNHPAPGNRGRVVRYPGATSVSLSSASTQSTTDLSPQHLQQYQNAPLSTSLPPGVYQPPPSYEEVIAQNGVHVNPVFKLDA